MSSQRKLLPYTHIPTRKSRPSERPRHTITHAVLPGTRVTRFGARALPSNEGVTGYWCTAEIARSVKRARTGCAGLPSCCTTCRGGSIFLIDFEGFFNPGSNRISDYWPVSVSLTGRRVNKSRLLQPSHASLHITAKYCALACMAETPYSSPFSPLSVWVSFSVIGLSNRVPWDGKATDTIQFSGVHKQALYHVSPRAKAVLSGTNSTRVVSI